MVFSVLGRDTFLIFVHPEKDPDPITDTDSGKETSVNFVQYQYLQIALYQ